MSKETWILQFLLIVLVQHCYLASSTTIEAAMQETAQAAVTFPVLSPPEGNNNTSSIDGTTWCVALPGVSQIALQKALDWACGPGKADCKPIQKGGSCFVPDTLVSHASYAFNDYYQRNGKTDTACNFGGTATKTNRNPSYEKCDYSTSGSGSASSSAPTFYKQKPSFTWWKVATLLLLLYLRS